MARMARMGRRQAPPPPPSCPLAAALPWHTLAPARPCALPSGGEGRAEGLASWGRAGRAVADHSPHLSAQVDGRRAAADGRGGQAVRELCRHAWSQRPTPSNGRRAFICGWSDRRVIFRQLIRFHEACRGLCMSFCCFSPAPNIFPWPRRRGRCVEASPRRSVRGHKNKAEGRTGGAKR